MVHLPKKIALSFLLLIFGFQFLVFSPAPVQAKFFCHSLNKEVDSEVECPGDFNQGNNFGQFNNGLVPCDTNCHFNDFIQLVENIINYLLIVAVPIAGVAFAYAGFLYLTAAGNPGKIEEAHGIFTSVMIGIIIMLVAWVLIHTLVSELVPDQAGYQNFFLKR